MSGFPRLEDWDVTILIVDGRRSGRDEMMTIPVVPYN